MFWENVTLDIVIGEELLLDEEELLLLDELLMLEELPNNDLFKINVSEDRLKNKNTNFLPLPLAALLFLLFGLLFLFWFLLRK